LSKLKESAIYNKFRNPEFTKLTIMIKDTPEYFNLNKLLPMYSAAHREKPPLESVLNPLFGLKLEMQMNPRHSRPGKELHQWRNQIIAKMWKRGY
jgi:hypothetical protein